MCLTDCLNQWEHDCWESAGFEEENEEVFVNLYGETAILHSDPAEIWTQIEGEEPKSHETYEKAYKYLWRNGFRE